MSSAHEVDPGSAPRRGAISLAQLFAAFSQMGLSGFGGVLPWARRVIVEQRRWMEPAEFTALLGLCQFLPGPNVINLAIVIGSRSQGWRGAIVAPLGLLAAPFLIVLGLGTLYGRYGHLAEVQAALRGMSATAVGLTVATGIKMAAGLRGRRLAPSLAVLTFLAVAVWRIPLLLALLVLAPAGIVLAAGRGQHQQRPEGR